ncbi:histidine biosynthesis protein [Methylosinus sp. H3A]|uniref:HisA/HisF-related TIM barrel protein n=1 Tax=Methylosinus sp. H3A TaxID=2785786 RepID=UPI0018C3076B|nr:HisA/HisF-related TIM barrel protein [Methylosinus sp. H3A]MBG0808915.1 histidine biosynthesis protein [Methylosinus sp. H3A]
MRIIPVIDLKGGHVVRAFRGERASYAPIVTPLAAGSAPEAVVAGFLRLHDFDTIYVADLDAIERRGDHGAAIDALAQRFPQICFWVDNGAESEPADSRSDAAPGPRAFGLANLFPVIGSESLAQNVAPDLSHEARAILSLDFRGDAFLGPRDLLDNPQLWPPRVIAMTLARVGAFAGPDLALLSSLARRAQGREIYAAGGLRDARDLERLAQIGVAGVLVASALHDGRLSRDDLRSA